MLLVLGSAAPTSTLAEQPCRLEVEPNDPETQSSGVAGAFCLTGDLPGDDQDFILWDKSADAPSQTWTISLTGATGILTKLVAYEVASAPGEAVLAGRSLFELRVEPADAEPATVTDLLLPDRLLLGLGRSSLPEGGEPVTTSYTVSVEPGTSLPAPLDSEPNDRSELGGRGDRGLRAER